MSRIDYDRIVRERKMKNNNIEDNKVLREQARKAVESWIGSVTDPAMVKRLKREYGIK